MEDNKRLKDEMIEKARDAKRLMDDAERTAYMSRCILENFDGNQNLERATSKLAEAEEKLLSASALVYRYLYDAEKIGGE